ncbi:hypothetical protein [Longimicrobium sp.]|uniref:hypothetical protein n=1 Tax=Longimicrobium sp. TaxID=2029185 RepID=UPI002E35125B|nr:hypothetical protein [Longimicrobium sp.]HEX6037713.1 hypothetical protein [Longimicrobium sp.]
MFDDLSPEEIALLKELAEKGAPVSEARLNADALRHLGMRRYIKRLSGFSIITPDGRKALQSLERGQQPAMPAHQARIPHPSARVVVSTQEAEDEEEADDTRVNNTQEDMLRQLALAEAPVPFDDLDGRVVRALEGRGLVRKADGLVELTDAGRTFYDTKVRRRRRARTSWAKTATIPVEGVEDRAARAALIREAVDALQRAVSDADELEIGDLPAPARDAFSGLLELADRIERGADPRRITRG